MRLQDQARCSDMFAMLRPFHEQFQLKATKLVARACDAELIPYDLHGGCPAIDSRHQHRETVSITMRWARLVNWQLRSSWWIGVQIIWSSGIYREAYKHLCRSDDMLCKPTARIMKSKVRRIAVSFKSRQRRSLYPNRNLFRCSITKTLKIKSQHRLSV